MRPANQAERGREHRAVEHEHVARVMEPPPFVYNASARVRAHAARAKRMERGEFEVRRSNARATESLEIVRAPQFRPPIHGHEHPTRADLERKVRFATAAASLKVSLVGIQTPALEQVERLAEEVRVEVVAKGEGRGERPN